MASSRGSKIRYLHLIKGRPAYFSQRFHMILTVDSGRTAPVVKTLRQILSEQADDLVARKREGFETDPIEYGYIKVRL